MLTGEHPFRRSLAADTAVAILGNQPESVSQLRPEVGEGLESVVMKLLAKEREERWQSIEEVRTSLASSLALAAGKGAGFSWASRAAVALLAVVAVVAVAWLWFSRSAPEVMLEPVPLTSLPGVEARPSFSPDGNEVAFEWGGENDDNRNIWIKQIDTGVEKQLTDDPAWDTFPAWSPDGLHIAFLRAFQGKYEIRVMPSRGGLDHKVTDVLLRPGNPDWHEDALAWSGDSEWLAVSTRESSEEPAVIFLVSIDSGQERRLTSPDPPAQGDVHPAFSPDNRTLAFSRVLGQGSSQVYLLELSEDYQPAGEPSQLTHELGVNRHPVWTLDGREIIFGHGTYATSRLYRIPVSGLEPIRPLNVSHGSGRYPALSSQQNRLAFADFNWPRLDIYRLELPPDPVANAGSMTWEPEKLYESTRGESFASYSQDGTKIAFVSLQSGNQEIWASNSDGTEEIQLTSFDDIAVAVNEPRWSPSGEKICFKCPLEGNNDICVIGSEGGAPENLTQHPANDRLGSLSRDGRWIYFQSDRSGDGQIWKIPAAGGEAEKVTENGGLFALESPDGQTLYFSRVGDGQQSLWKMPVQGGEERLVLPKLKASGAAGTYQLGPKGIYFFPDSTSFHFLPFGADKAIPITVPDPAQWPFLLRSISPDGRWALLDRWYTAISDLELVENFR